MTGARRDTSARLLGRHAISKGLVQRLLAWRHPGFSAHVGERFDPEDEQRNLRRAAPPTLRPTWARLIAKVCQVDPLLCTRCGQKMQILRVAEQGESWGVPASWE